LKKSLFFKIFISISLIVVFNFIINIAINQIYMKKFYVNELVRNMEKVLEKIKNNTFSKDEIESLEEENNMKIFITKEKLNGKYLNERKKIRHFFQNVEESKFEELKNGKSILIENSIGVFETMDLATYKDDTLIIISISKTSIKENVRLYQKFYGIAGFITFLIGVIITFLLAKKIVQPIKNINEVTKNMANLSFDKMCNITTEDEIGELGKNINYLSHSLETNIQNLKIANEKLKEDMEKDKKIADEKREFIGSVSHELKTPITLINTYIESMVEGIVEEEEIDYYYSVIIEEGKKLTELLDNLLKFLETNKITKYQMVNINLDEILKSEVEKYIIEANKKNVKIITNYNSDKKKIEVQYENLIIVINNFLSNAIRHVSENGEINVSVNSIKDKLIIEIYNSGSNISETEFENIWQPFYRIDKSRNRKYGGTGLGLSIVKKILDEYNCKYGIKNIDNGVIFWFEI